MPSNHKSPYAASFKSAVKNGTPCSVAINNIAKNKSATPKSIFNSLFKAGLCFRQKFNSQWVYWSSEWNKKSNSTNRSMSQSNMWQSFIDWIIGSGFCTPEQLKNHCGSQKEFMTFCRKFFSKQFSASTPAKNRKTNTSSRKTNKRTPTTAKKRSTPTKTKARKTTRKPAKSTSTRGKSYTFPTAKKSTSTRRYRKAA